MNADRFFLARHFDLGEVGLYALAAKLAGCVAMVSALPLQRVWLLQQYETLPKEDGPRKAARWFTLCAAAQLAVGLGLTLFCRELLTLIGREEYVRCADFVPILVLAEFFLHAYYVLEGPMFVYRKTLLKFYIGLAVTIVMLALFPILVPKYGSLGAGAATLLGYAFLCGVSWYFSQRLRRIDYDWKAVATLLVLAVFFYAVSELTLRESSMALRIAVKSGLLVVYLSVVAAFRPWRL